MATKVHMEALSPTMEEGRLVKWTKREGDAAKTGETIAEVETDKAVMELVARADGQLIKVVAAEGSTVPVGNVVAYIGAPGEKVDGAGSQESGAGAAKPAPAAAVPKAAPAPAPVRTPTAPTPAPVSAPADATRVKASPLARRIAMDAGVDLKLVQGSGPGGRVIKRDIEGGVAQAQAAAAPPPSSRLPTPGVPYDDVPLTQIGAEARDLAQKARSRRLKPDEYTGATFSVSNLGMFDIDEFTAVINPPEAGILAVGTVVEKPVVLEGQVVPRKRLRLTMSCDHRVIDGATGAAFLKTLKQMLENPLAMVL